jgi:hypothetical protein
MMKKVVGTFERVSDASGAVRAIRTAGFLASDVELVVRRADVGVADGDPASTASGAASRIVAAGLAGGALGGLAGLALPLMGVALPGFDTVLTAGPITAALTGAGLGAIAGSAMGGMTGFGVRRAHTEHELESLRRGGALVAVHADESRVDEVERILHQQCAYLIEDRVVPRRDDAWRAGKPRFSSEAIDRGRAHGLARPNRLSAGARR